jgi:hypothetical protein
VALSKGKTRDIQFMKKMNTFPQCPANLPDDIKATAWLLAQTWAENKFQPHVANPGDYIRCKDELPMTAKD